MLNKEIIEKKSSEILLDNNENNVEIFTDEHGKKYSHNSILSGIIYFSSFKSMDKVNLGIGEYIAPIGDFDVNKALMWASKNCGRKSQGACAKYVRLMLESGGINTSGHPVSAYQYAWFLPSKGFKHIMSLKTKSEQSNWSNSSAKPGDIAVMVHGQHGHICMWTGRQWVSDFVQNNMWPYAGDGEVNIFRYNG